MSELKIEWNETLEEERFEGEWIRWRGRANGEEVMARINDEVEEDECDRAVIVPLDGGEQVKEELNSRNAAPALEVAKRKIQDHYAKTGKVPSMVRVVPSDFPRKRAANF